MGCLSLNIGSNYGVLLGLSCGYRGPTPGVSGGCYYGVFHFLSYCYSGLTLDTGSNSPEYFMQYIRALSGNLNERHGCTTWFTATLLPILQGAN